MQERKKKKIVIASVLKPVDETRMFEKIGLSLSKEGHEVSILGYVATADQIYSPLLLLPSSAFKRISLKRLVAPLRLFIRWWRLRPDVLIITTHELLFLGALTRIITSCKIIYDVQENYYLNILHTTAFPKALRFPIAALVRSYERLTSSFIHHFILAESIYAQQLKFVGEKYTVVENKFASPETVLINQQKGFHRLLFSGTLAETTGVFTAIQLSKQLHALDPAISLTIIGYAPQAAIYELIKKESNAHAFITLIGGNTLVPHAQIIEQIHKADYGLICYTHNKSTLGRTPTKFYEYAASGLRLLIATNQGVKINTHGGTLGITQQERENPQALLERMKNFILPDVSKRAFLWETEVDKLLYIIKSL